MNKQVWLALVLVGVVGVAVGTLFLGPSPKDRTHNAAELTGDAVTEGEADASEVLEDLNKSIARVGDFEFLFHRTIVDLGGAHPEVSNTYEARHAVTQKPIKATDIFSEQALIASFTASIHGDSYATDLETKSTFQRLKTSKSASDLNRHLAALEASTSLRASESCDGEIFTFDPMSENFAIVDYSESTGKAVVHFGVGGTSHVCDSGFPRLKLYVEVPASLKAALLEAASGKKGFLPKLSELKACDTCEPVDFDQVELSGP
jgi:hypothetical protein